jgi:hypothetical protein
MIINIYKAAFCQSVHHVFSPPIHRSFVLHMVMEDTVDIVDMMDIVALVDIVDIVDMVERLQETIR